MNQALGSWFRPGAQERMAFLASAEEHLATVTQRLIAEPTMDNLAVTTASLDEMLAACNEGLQWLAAHRCPVDAVGDPLSAAFTQFRIAAETLLRMNSGVLPMSAASGEIAAEALSMAHHFLYDTAMTFAREIMR